MWFLIVSIPDLCTLTFFNYRFYRTRHLVVMNGDRNMNLPDLTLSTILLPKTDIGINFFFRKNDKIFELRDFRNGVCLRILVAAPQP